MRRGDRDLGPVAYAQLAHDFADMDFHGCFGHAELATDDLVGVALAEANQNGVLPFGKLGRGPYAVEAMVALHAGRLVVEKGALRLVKAVFGPERGRLRLFFRPPEPVPPGKVRQAGFHGARGGEGPAGPGGSA